MISGPLAGLSVTYTFPPSISRDIRWISRVKSFTIFGEGKLIKDMRMRTALEEKRWGTDGAVVGGDFV